MRYQYFTFVALLAVLSSGCAHTRLHKRTNAQFSTLTDIYEKQVMDNLAMFCVNPDATPFFARVKGGVIGVNDSLNSGSNLAWNATTFTGASLSPSVGRSLTNNWSVEPIDNVPRLQLMRCAYRKAVGIDTCQDTECGNCCMLARKWHGPADLDEQCTALVTDGDQVVNCNVKCSPGCGWFCVGNKRDVPDNCCGAVGEYCGTYVWVKPDGREALHRLTMLIIDYATGESYSPPTDEVVRKYKFDAGQATLTELSVTSNETNDGLQKLLQTQRKLDPHHSDAKSVLRQLEQELVDNIANMEREKTATDNPAMLDAKLFSLKSQLDKVQTELMKLKLQSIAPPSNLPLPRVAPERDPFRKAPSFDYEPGYFFQGR